MDVENNCTRYLVKKPFVPLGLTSVAQNVLFQSLDKVSKLSVNLNTTFLVEKLPDLVSNSLFDEALK